MHFSENRFSHLLRGKCHYGAEMWTQCTEREGEQIAGSGFLISGVIVREKIKNPLLATCSPFISVACVQISAQKPFFRGGDTKMVILRKLHFCENWPFLAKNGQICARFAIHLDFLWFSTILSIVPTIPVIFSIIDHILAKV